MKVEIIQVRFLNEFFRMESVSIFLISVGFLPDSRCRTGRWGYHAGAAFYAGLASAVTIEIQHYLALARRKTEPSLPLRSAIDGRKKCGSISSQLVTASLQDGHLGTKQGTVRNITIFYLGIKDCSFVSFVKVGECFRVRQQFSTFAFLNYWLSCACEHAVSSPPLLLFATHLFFLCETVLKWYPFLNFSSSSSERSREVQIKSRPLATDVFNESPFFCRVIVLTLMAIDLEERRYGFLCPGYTKTPGCKNAKSGTWCSLDGNDRTYQTWSAEVSRGLEDFFVR